LIVTLFSSIPAISIRKGGHFMSIAMNWASLSERGENRSPLKELQVCADPVHSLDEDLRKSWYTEWHLRGYLANSRISHAIIGLVGCKPDKWVDFTDSKWYIQN
jgi:hypothetical protein